jgi:hypothetical protein
MQNMDTMSRRPGIVRHQSDSSEATKLMGQSVSSKQGM